MSTLSKQFYVHAHRIGAGSRHSIRFHDGVSTNRDGSAFFDLRTFRNKRDLTAFVAQLRRDGYSERSWAAA